MKLGLKITIIVLSCILLAVVITATVGGVIAGRINDKTAPCDSLSSWQSYIKDDALLKSVIIPGSHDAGTAGMPWFSVTQDRNIAEQLACGTRYFDLRIKMKNGECRIYHGPSYSLYLKDILRDIRDFLDANPSESLILDVHKFGNGEAKVKTVEMLDEYLTGKLVTNTTDKGELEFIEALTLGETRGKCVLIWGDVDEYSLNDNRYFTRNDDEGDRDVGCLQSFYKMKWNGYYSSKKYISKAIPFYIGQYKDSIGGLFVLQCQLTDGTFVMGPRYREGLHEKNMNECVLAFAGSGDLEYLNVIMRDFVSPAKNCYALTLNLSKELVKPECVEDYTSMLKEHITYDYNH